MSNNFNSKRAEKEEDNSLWTISDMVDDIVEDAEKIQANKAVTILLRHDTEAKVYHHTRLTVNMSNSEIIALLQLVCMRLAREMDE